MKEVRVLEILDRQIGIELVGGPSHTYFLIAVPDFLVTFGTLPVGDIV